MINEGKTPVRKKFTLSRIMDKFLLIGYILTIVLVGIDTKPLENIPGLDHLMSGFDGSKMKSIADLKIVSQGDKIKAAIFDWNKFGRPYILKTDGYTQTFQTPSIVHVVDVGRRTEISCGTIATSFEDFYE